MSGGEAANRLVEAFPPITIFCATCINPVSAPQYNNASAVSGGAPVCFPSSSLLYYFRVRSAETTSSPGILLLEGEHSLGREQFSISNVAITGIESSIGIRSSKSLSRRRSFSITAWRNYKGARNCSPGAYRSPRKSRNAPSRRDVRPSIKYRPGKWILKPYM